MCEGISVHIYIHIYIYIFINVFVTIGIYVTYVCVGIYILEAKAIRRGIFEVYNTVAMSGIWDQNVGNYQGPSIMA